MFTVQRTRTKLAQGNRRSWHRACLELCDNRAVVVQKV
jgi:hypothetical protein